MFLIFCIFNHQKMQPQLPREMLFDNSATNYLDHVQWYRQDDLLCSSRSWTVAVAVVAAVVAVAAVGCTSTGFHRKGLLAATVQPFFGKVHLPESKKTSKTFFMRLKICFESEGWAVDDLLRVGTTSGLRSSRFLTERHTSNETNAMMTKIGFWLRCLLLTVTLKFLPDAIGKILTK